MNVGPSIFEQSAQETIMNNSGTFTETIPNYDTSIYLMYSNYSGTNGFPPNYYEFTVKVTPFNDRGGLWFLNNPGPAGNWSCDQGGFGSSVGPLNQALEPLLTKYNLLPILVNAAISSNSTGFPILTGSGTATTVPFWSSTYIGDGTATFTLYSNGNNNPLTSQQINSLTQDLQAALTTASNSS
jgi:hypothetical protein